MHKSTLASVHLFVAAVIACIAQQGDCLRCYSCGSTSETSDCYRLTSAIAPVECPDDMPFCSYTENREPWIYPNETTKSPLVQVILGCSRTLRKQNCVDGKYCTWKTCYEDNCNCYSPDCNGSSSIYSKQWSNIVVPVIIIFCMVLNRSR